MADVIATDSVELELEAMRKDDFSWHPCQVYFSPNGASLVIQYENNDSQDTLVSEKEALMRIRARSIPLQDDDCTKIKPGDQVVVSQNSDSQTCGFFDAEVEKVQKVRHSKRTNCKCTFIIKWLHQNPDGGSLTVPSTSVMRLANKHINNHPTISAFIDANSSLNVVSDFDLDLHDLLEKQIEGIKNSVHGSKKRIRDEILGLEDNTDEQVKEPEIHVSTVSPLNPLAARAALASLMSKSQTPEISNSNITKLPLETETAQKTVKNVKKSLFSTPSSSDVSQVSEDSSAAVVNRSGKGRIKSDNTDPKIKPRLTRAKSQQGNGVPDDIKKSSSIADDNIKADQTNPEIKTRLTRAKSQQVNSLPDDNIEKSNCIIDGNIEAKKTNPEMKARLTRAKSQKVNSDGNIETSNHIDSKKSSPLSNSNRRFTRSVLHQEPASVKTEPEKESGGNVRSDGGSSCGTKKKNPVNLSKHKVLRSSPRFNT